MTRLRGLLPVLATPFDDAGELDLTSLQRLVRFQLAAGADGLAVFGMASEGFALTTAERRLVLDVMHEEVDGRVPVIAGVNATSTATAIEQAELCAKHGADALMVLPPFMVKPTAAQLAEFYTEVAAATSCEVMVQDAPNATGVAMNVAQVGELCRLPGVSSVKIEAPPTASKVAATLHAVPDTVSVLAGGNAFFLIEELHAGAAGTMPACEFTDLLAPVMESAAARNWLAARAGFDRLLPLIRFGTQPGLAWAVHKEVLVRRNVIASARVRLPAQPLDPASTAMLEEILAPLAMAPYDEVIGG